MKWRIVQYLAFSKKKEKKSVQYLDHAAAATKKLRPSSAFQVQ